MPVDDLGVAATVRDHASDWTPDGSESGLDDYRRSLRDHLDRRLNPSVPGNGEHVVETHRSGASPDVTVDGAVGILVEPVVSEGGQGRLRTRLDRFDGAYALMLTVAVEVRDESAWERLRDAYSTDYGVTGTAYDFLAASESREREERSESPSIHPRAGEESRLREWLQWVVYGIMLLPVAYVGLAFRFEWSGGEPPDAGGLFPVISLQTEVLVMLAAVFLFATAAVTLRRD